MLFVLTSIETGFFQDKSVDVKLKVERTDVDADNAIDGNIRLSFSVKTDASTSAIKEETIETPMSSHSFQNLIKSETIFKREPSSDRQIEVEFLETSNECKYDELVKKQKIKNPVKRRLSNNSSGNRSTSPQQNSNVDDICSPKKKRRSLPNYAKIRGTEMDEATLARRTKQIDYGKNTLGYDNYRNAVPK